MYFGRKATQKFKDAEAAWAARSDEFFDGGNGLGTPKYWAKYSELKQGHP